MARTINVTCDCCGKTEVVDSGRPDGWILVRDERFSGGGESCREVCSFECAEKVIVATMGGKPPHVLTFS